MFWKPTVDRDADGSTVLIHNRHKHLSIVQQRNALPISRYQKHLEFAVDRYRVVVLVSETGTGKSTQVPQFLHEAGWTQAGKCIVCTQPRRMAAITIAARVAEETGTPPGAFVGYAIRFETNCTASTKLKYCTDGLLIRETLTDPLLSKYSVIMVDEAHERSLNTDILLGLLKKIMKRRPELRIIIASASMDAQGFKDFFELNRSLTSKANVNNENEKESREGTSFIFNVQGRTHDVDLLYLEKPARNYIEASVDTVLKIHKGEDWGDVLVFMPGGEEIDAVVRLLDEYYQGGDLMVLPLYSSLPTNLQMRVFEPTPPRRRKVVIATNIAETSLTIEGIRFVIDAGFARLNYFDPHTGIESLVTCPVSKASATQRAGRAGRTEPGKCFRLMPEPAYENLEQHAPPEMQRTDITAAVLQLKALGIDDVLHFDFMSPPSSEAMIFALELLYSLGALDIGCKLTPLGERMAEMPMDPRMSKSLLNSWNFGCSEEMLMVAAMCTVDHPFITQRPRASQDAKQRLLECIGEFASTDGDHITLLHIFRAYQDANCDSSWCDSVCLKGKVMQRAKEVHKHLEIMLKRSNPNNMAFASCGSDYKSIRQCLVSGYFANAARMGPDGKYYTLRGNAKVSVHPSSVLAHFGTPPEWVIYNEIVQSQEPQMRDISKVEPLWLHEFASHYYQLSNMPI